MLKRILIIGFLLVAAIHSYCQHFPIYSQYMMNGLAINPAYAGSRDVLSATMLYRNQWVGFEGAPTTYSLGVHAPFRNQRIAVGLILFNEQIGISSNTGLYGNYAYRVKLGTGKLALGIKAGFSILNEDNSKISTKIRDDAFGNNPGASFLPNFGVGAYYYNSNYFAGLSVPTILSYREGGNSSGMKAYNDFKNYNIFLTGGTLIKLTNEFKLKPSTLIKYHQGLPLQYDLNLNMIFFKDDLLWVGASYRNKEALVGIIEIQLFNWLRLGYSYDYSLGPLGNYNSGSHEVMLRYELGNKVNSLDPRYF